MQNGIRMIGNCGQLLNTTQGYRRMVIVRHPIDRFVSAFNYLVVKEQSSIYRSMLSEWVDRHVNDSNSLLPFQQFVKAVFSGFRNQHWQPYARDCLFESTDYDDVMRQETYRHDFEPLLTNYLSYSWAYATGQYINILRSNITEVSISSVMVSHRYLPIFEQISRQDRLALKEMYRDDLQLLGYDFDVDTLKASCRIKTEDGRVCC